jgi:hypothetical protein
MQSIIQRIGVPFITFIALFIGTGFVSGSIVHMGEGINPWDLSLLGIGVVLFIGGSLFQDMQQGWKRVHGEGITVFLLLSLCLSIGIGMASGGMQHFVDTPAYSALLIPVGLAIGLFAFTAKERIELSRREWLLGAPVVVLITIVGIVGLRVVAQELPGTLRQDHHSAPSATPRDTTQVTTSSSDDHGH